MIRLESDGYGYGEPSYVDAGEVASIHVRARHAMDDRNTTVVTLKNGSMLDTCLRPEDIRNAVENALRSVPRGGDHQ